MVVLNTLEPEINFEKFLRIFRQILLLKTGPRHNGSRGLVGEKEVAHTVHIRGDVREEELVSSAEG